MAEGTPNNLTPEMKSEINSLVDERLKSVVGNGLSQAEADKIRIVANENGGFGNMREKISKSPLNPLTDKSGKVTWKRAGITGAAGLVGVAALSDNAAAWLTETLKDVGDTVVKSAAQIGAEAQYEGWNATLGNMFQMLNKLVSVITGNPNSQFGLKIANSFRQELHNQPPEARVNGHLVEMTPEQADAAHEAYKNGEPLPASVTALGAPATSASASVENIDLAGVFSSEAFETAMKDEITARYARDSGLNLNDEAQFEATTVSALARIGASDATIDRVHEVFEKGDLSGNFNVSNVEIGPGPTLQNAFAQQADRLFEKGAEAFKASGGNLDTVATSMTRSLG